MESEEKLFSEERLLTEEEACAILSELIEMRREQINNLPLPSWGEETLTRYRDHGTPAGSFVEAILCNDLMGACSRADVLNRSRLHDYCRFLFTHMPIGSYGCQKNYDDWIKMGGLNGMRKTTGES